jgi:hypothetical protein
MSVGIFSQAERVSENGSYRVWSRHPGLICALAVTDAKRTKYGLIKKMT